MERQFGEPVVHNDNFAIMRCVQPTVTSDFVYVCHSVIADIIFET
jgi:hypothetical protein